MVVLGHKKEVVKEYEGLGTSSCSPTRFPVALGSVLRFAPRRHLFSQRAGWRISPPRKSDLDLHENQGHLLNE